MNSDFKAKKSQAIFMSVALLCSVYFGIALINLLKFEHTAQKVSGSVIERSFGHFTIQYVVAQTKYSITEPLPKARGMSSRGHLVEGAEVSVLYNPHNPQQAKWDSHRDLIFDSLMLFFSILGIGVGLKRKNNKMIPNAPL